MLVAFIKLCFMGGGLYYVYAFMLHGNYAQKWLADLGMSIALAQHAGILK